ncbi:MAG: F0F1 ATP synthase subunit B [Pirellulaceae bacterium]
MRYFDLKTTMACLIACLAIGVLTPIAAAQDADDPAPADGASADADGVADADADGDADSSADGGAAAAPTAGTADAGGGHAGHDGHEADLSHVNATGSLEAPEEFKYDLAIYTFVVFFLLLLILMKFAWRPIMDGLKKREDGIAAQIEEARLANERARKSLEEYEAKLATAADEVRGLIAEGRREAEASRDRILAEAQEAAQRERERALAEIGAAKNQALSEIAGTHVDHAFALARQIVRKEISHDQHAQLIRDSLDRFPTSSN